MINPSTNPRFAVGDTVKHLPTQSQGRIVGVVNEEDLEDVRAQGGFRYTVATRTGLRSALEHNLKMVAPKT